MKYSEEVQSRPDQKRDAWYGMVHVKDRSYLHQRSAKHYYNSGEGDIVVPNPILEEDDDVSPSAARRVIKKILTIALIAAVAVFVLGMIAFIIWGRPGLADLNTSNAYKIF